MSSKKVLEAKTCTYCSTAFFGGINRRFCDSEHRTICEVCGNIFIPTRKKMQNNIKVCTSCLRLHQGERIRLLALSGQVGFGNPEIRAKAQRAIQEKYGVDNVSQVPSIKEKAKATTLERHGAESPFGSKKVQRKIAKTNLERYGAENTFASEEIKTRIKKVLLDRYGVENVTLNPDIRAKQLESMTKKHGVSYALQNPSLLDVQKSTLLERYGVDNPAKIEEIRKKSRELRQKVSDEKFEEILVELANDSISGKISPEILRENFGYSNSSPVYKRIHRLELENLVQYGGQSVVNQRWKNILESKLNVELQSEISIFSNKRWKVDFCHKESRVAIDINPTVSHSTQKTHPFYTPKSKSYHQIRALDAQKNGWSLYQVYDWASENKILHDLQELINPYKEEISLGDRSIVKLSLEDAKSFLKKHYLTINANEIITYAETISGEITQAMTFSKSAEGSVSENYDVANYYKTRTGTGNFNQLFQAFLKDRDPKMVRASFDLDFGRDNPYEPLGFRLDGLGDPREIYSKLGSHEKRDKINCSDGSDHEEESKETLNSQGFYLVSDSGYQKFLWEKDSSPQHGYNNNGVS